MKIRTNYDCEFEQKDLVNLSSGHALSATLSDGSIAFRFRMDPALVQGNGMRRVKSVVAEPSPAGPKLLTDGTPPKKSHTYGGTCTYCKKGPYANVAGHVRTQHPGKPLHATGKFRCVQCPQRFASHQGLKLHLGFSHKVAKPAKKEKEG